MTEKCEDRIDNALEREIRVIRKLWELYKEDPEAYDDDYGNFNDYGLCFDYVAPGTFGDQREGYFRYQLSWGGPSDEFRFYVNPDFSVHRIEYWFLDWFDGASRWLFDDDRKLLEEIFEYFKDCGAVEVEYVEATKPDFTLRMSK